MFAHGAQHKSLYHKAQPELPGLWQSPRTPLAWHKMIKTEVQRATYHLKSLHLILGKNRNAANLDLLPSASCSMGQDLHHTPCPRQTLNSLSSKFLLHPNSLSDLSVISRALGKALTGLPNFDLLQIEPKADKTSLLKCAPTETHSLHASISSPLQPSWTHGSSSHLRAGSLSAPSQQSLSPDEGSPTNMCCSLLGGNEAFLKVLHEPVCARELGYLPLLCDLTLLRAQLNFLTLGKELSLLLTALQLSSN